MKKIKRQKHENKTLHLFLPCQKSPEVSTEKNRWAEPSGRKTAKSGEGEVLKRDVTASDPWSLACEDTSAQQSQPGICVFHM